MNLVEQSAFVRLQATRRVMYGAMTVNVVLLVGRYALHGTSLARWRVMSCSAVVRRDARGAAIVFGKTFVFSHN